MKRQSVIDMYSGGEAGNVAGDVLKNVDNLRIAPQASDKARALTFVSDSSFPPGRTFVSGSFSDDDASSSQSPMFVGGKDSDEVSCSFSVEGVSLCTEKESPASVEMHSSTAPGGEDNDLSTSGSINTKALGQITELTKKLRIQEKTKLELLQLCLKLEERLEKNDCTCKHAFLQMYKEENQSYQLREANAKMERYFMNEMSDMEKDYQDQIERLKRELKLAKENVSLDKFARL